VSKSKLNTNKLVNGKNINKKGTYVSTIRWYQIRLLRKLRSSCCSISSFWCRECFFRSLSIFLSFYLVFAVSVLCRITVSAYLFSIFKLLRDVLTFDICLSSVELRFLLTSLVSSNF
jgi:hypothetical protein